MVSRTLMSQMPELPEFIKFVGDNARELLDGVPDLQLQQMKHRPIGDFIKPKTNMASARLPKIIALLKGRGFVDHFTISSQRFQSMSLSAFASCCNGTHRFADEWTSFHCMYEGVVVFAFRDPNDAILARLHL